ncbi:unnamed protein product [Medioppia subpectinata]|uniref:Uncharacterized protein n=1 Tax=Medioppia subpectinata TaxID=1979941 RepID=A0A7R9PWZ7_9ACAR|nr:unnamed protein product [Medioppia subpectinata]CAG2104488.1 unnamed protein product [Medioppia subpectinata]
MQQDTKNNARIFDLYESPKLDALQSSGHNGRQPQQQSRLVVVSGRTHSIVANVLDKGFGDRKANHQLKTLLDNAFTGRDESNRVDDDLWRGFAVFTTTTDGNRFQQISRHIARQSAQNKPSIWFMFTGLRPIVSHSVPALMTIPAFKASVETSAQMLSPLGVDGSECLTETIDWKTEFNERNIHRVFIATAVHHMAFVDAMSAVGITADGYLGSSLGELMCLYMDGLCDRRHCLAICRAIKPPTGPHRLWSIIARNSWPEIQRHCMDRTDICVFAHFADTYIMAVGREAAVRELSDVLTRLGTKVANFGSKPISQFVHAGNMFVPNMSKALLDQLIKVEPERTMNSKPSERWLSTSKSITNTGGTDAGFSVAESFANTLLSPILLKEAVDRLPADALVVNIAINSDLRDIALSGRVQEPYVRQSESNLEPVFGINHLLREIGLVFTAGHWPRDNTFIPAGPGPGPDGFGSDGTTRHLDPSGPGPGPVDGSTSAEFKNNAFL